MKIRLIAVGKTTQDFVEEGVGMYRSRVEKYLPFEIVVIPALKKTRNLSPDDFRQKEGELILKRIGNFDVTILLEEKGKEMSSTGFADFLQQKMNTGTKTLNFVIGGAYGFSSYVKQVADGKISLSKMTFSHQIVRVIFMEQLYRAFTILRNEPYHNQ